MPVFSDDSTEPNRALSALLNRGRRILRVDLVQKFPFWHQRHPEHLLIGRLKSGCHAHASHDYQGDQPENSHFLVSERQVYTANHRYKSDVAVSCSR